MNKRVSESLEDYLEQLYIFESKNSESTTVTELAAAMNVTKSAITKATKKLVEGGFILKEDYGKIQLTPYGKDYASHVYNMHNDIKVFLMNIGVSEKIASIDCCKLEHIISLETLLKIREFNKNFRK